jgi:ribonuclease HI
MFTDGAAQGNPGPGGYGVILRSGKHYKELSQGFELTTNNRMELLAVIVGLEQIKKDGSAVNIFSDSRYVVDAIEKGWIHGWKKKAFSKVKNADLWQRFLLIYPRHKVRLHWVKGHAGHPENTRCDELAVAAARSPRKLIDEGYLKSLENSDEALF